jgi:hypothetical protein
MVRVCGDCRAFLGHQPTTDASLDGMETTGMCDLCAAKWRQELDDGDRQRRRDLWGAKTVRSPA